MTAAYLLNHPQHVEHVLHTNHQNYRGSPSVQSVEPLIGNGASFAEKDLRARQRKLVRPAFRRGNLELLSGHVVNAVADHLVKWEDASRTAGEINLSHDMSELATNVIAQMFFGTSSECESDRLYDALQLINTVTARRVWDTTALVMNLPSSESGAYDAAFDEVSDVVEQAIRNRRKNSNRTTDLLGVLLDACDPKDASCLSDAQLQDEVATLMVAGFESTASLLLWALSFLSENSHVRENLRNEADTILQGRPPTNSILKEMEYTKRVVQEVARLRPTVWSFSRTAIDDDVIGGEPIKAGTTVLICQYVLHKLPTEWHDPERFDPDRFLPEQVAGRSKFAYLPFGAGPRVCIGSGLTMMEMQIILPLIYRKFDVDVTQEFEPDLGGIISLKPKRDVRARVKGRVRH